MYDSNPKDSHEFCSRVAVYGTLRTGESNHFLFRESGAHLPSLGTFKLPGYSCFVMSATSFRSIPFIANNDELVSMGHKPAGAVTVEVFTCGPDEWDELLENLDSLEGHPSWYLRTLVEIGGERTWVYVFTGEVLESYLDISSHRQIVPTGDWLNPLPEVQEVD